MKRSKRLRWAAIAHALVFTFVVQSSLAPLSALAGDVERGEAYCASPNHKMDSIHDPCLDAKTKTDAIHHKNSDILMWTAATGVCGTACFTGLMSPHAGLVCTMANGAAALGEIVNMVSMGKNMQLDIMNIVTSVGTAVGAKALGNQVLGFFGKELTKDQLKGQAGERLGACAGFALAALNTSIRYYNRKMLEKERDAAYVQALNYVPKTPTLLGGGWKDTQQSGVANASFGDPGATSPTKPKVKADCTTAAKCTESAATMGYAPILDDFQNMSGRSANDLAQKILDGAPPLLALGEVAGSSMSPEAQQGLKDLHNAADPAAQKILAIAGQQNPNAAVAYEATGSGGGSKKKSDGVDFNSILSAMMPKKAEDEGAAAGTRGPQVIGAKTQAAQMGLHPASRSIFDVVDARYELVVPGFLAGKAPEGQPMEKPSLLPANPYLKR